MKVFVPGASGAIGARVVRGLLERGDEVVGLTRSEEKAAMLRNRGATAVTGDVLDAARMMQLFAETRPDGVIQVLNALPRRGALRPADLEATNELRITGTANLIAAALAHGVRRYVAESMIFVYGYGRHDEPVTEEVPVMRAPEIAAVRPALEALISLEEQVLKASTGGDLGGVVLRYGLFYGPGIGSTEFIASLARKRLLGLPGGGEAVGSWIHIEDAAAAAIAALDSDRSGETYNVVDDEPVPLHTFATELASHIGARPPYRLPAWTARLGGRYLAATTGARLPVSNAKIRRELDWAPLYPSIREGLHTL